MKRDQRAGKDRGQTCRATVDSRRIRNYRTVSEARLADLEGAVVDACTPDTKGHLAVDWIDDTRTRVIRTDDDERTAASELGRTEADFDRACFLEPQDDIAHAGPTALEVAGMR